MPGGCWYQPGFYGALRSRARRLAAMRVGETSADDVAQAALLRVFARASEFTPGRPCLPWFYAIVVNEIRGAQRRDARLVPTDLDDDAANAIAAVLGRAPVPLCAPATFRKRVSRAYAKLRLILGANDAV